MINTSKFDIGRLFCVFLLAAISCNGADFHACDNFIVDSIPGGKPAVVAAALNHSAWIAERGPIEPFAGKWKYEFERVLDMKVSETIRCKDLKVFGALYDEMKYFCSPPDQRRDCTVFSIGGNNKWEFEEQMFRDTDCDIHTFDCTCDGVVPAEIQSRTTFHKKCWGKNADQPDDYLSYENLLQISGATKVTYLKIDIEGYEWSVLSGMAAAIHENSDLRYNLPLQMFIEFHLDRGEIGKPVHHVGDRLVNFFERMFSVGYMIMMDRMTLQTRNHDVLLTKVLC